MLRIVAIAAAGALSASAAVAQGGIICRPGDDSNEATLFVVNDDVLINGQIDEVAIWRRALTDEQVRFLWNGGAGRALRGL